jgi:hypothetical protein
VVATVRPNRAGLDSSQPELTLPAKSPFDATIVTLDAGDVLADAILQEGLPRHELEAESILDHGETSADE